MKESKYKNILKFMYTIEPSRVETQLQNLVLQKILTKTEVKQLLNDYKNGTR